MRKLILGRRMSPRSMQNRNNPSTIPSRDAARLCRRLVAGAIIIAVAGCASAHRRDFSQLAPTEVSPPPATASSASDAASAPAPELAATSPGSSGPALASRDTDQLLPSPPGRYRLGPGDVVTVAVWGHPELSGKHTVGPDGNIQIPFVGSIRISDETANDASAKITGALREMYALGAASVTIDSYNGNQVFVFGRVAHPGILRFSDEPTLLEALARAGSAQGQAEVGGMATRCAVIRGRDRLMWIDLRPLLRGQDPSLNLALQRNDVIYVPDADSELVYVMGEVKNPGAYPMTANMTFLEALSRAGGPNDNAQRKKVLLERPNKKMEESIDLENFVEKSEANYKLEAGDIVYVPKSGVSKIGYFMQQLNPITTIGLFGAAM
jgi:polysaccharide export outer membrane protein